MALTEQEVADIAHLARLAIADEDVPGYCVNLSRILDFVAQIDAVEADIEPMSNPEEALGQRLRADEVAGTVDRERFQENAAHTEAGLYLVPQVME